jgi:hypothetical protein
MDPSTEERYAFMPLAELDERWHDVTGFGPSLAHVDHQAIDLAGPPRLTE